MSALKSGECDEGSSVMDNQSHDAQSGWLDFSPIPASGIIEIVDYARTRAARDSPATHKLRQREPTALTSLYSNRRAMTR